MPVVLTTSERETEAFGERLAPHLHRGDVVALYGDLGAGKTTLVRGLARGLGAADQVSSPTFVLLNIYEGRLPLYHFDAYRLAGPADLEAIGAEEYLYGDGVAVVEWSERAEGVLPEDRLDLAIDRGPGPDDRRLSLSARGPRARKVLEGLQ